MSAYSKAASELNRRMKTRSPDVVRITDPTASQHAIFRGKMGGSGLLFWENRCLYVVGDGTFG